MDRVARPVLAVPVLLAALLAAAGCSPAGTPSSSAGSASASGSALSSATPSPGTAGPSGTAATPTAPESPSPTPTGPSALDWPSYHRTLDRAGTVAGLPAVHELTPAWTAALDGAVYGQPIVVGGLAIAATEADTVYGLDLTTGAVRWTTHLGTPVPRSDLPCGNIDPLGITGTPAYDATTGSVFVVAETTGGRHDLVALDVLTGTERWRQSLDVTTRNPLAEQQRGALAVANGRVYVPFGGLYGDCGDYVGYVTATPVGGGTTTSYAVPTSREGGIWAASGVAVDGGGDAWVAVGNGASTGGTYDGSDSVLRLAPDLSQRLDYFAPASWGSQNARDQDLGSTGPVLLGGNRVLVSGKDAEVYLLDGEHLGGVGGQLATLTGCAGYGGIAWDRTAAAAFVPCRDGLLRVDVGSTTLQGGWKAPANIAGSPVVGHGAVWSVDAAGGRLYALDEVTGASITTADVGTTSRFASPVLAGGFVLVPTLAGVSAVAVG
ncbi:PQQ-binding-like beta-propeller repeat protein [Actinotalea sp. M2MS4P-6]|uniref:outer membrane protein assembly factor BamB family protein n=1 Tax=Actinotalea sp. M2MS4P-6 TaxID=2983762 RepID=UPI0021E45529|nr:PQQ-binding-like beta-propeller repeat protein [Actinotalea sp. M2MS4P-6]MCV2396255.1 PQQ-binding-like beta-propeller repeat protein [Actinotalea sp. M2MS4P-6]